MEVRNLEAYRDREARHKEEELMRQQIKEEHQQETQEDPEELELKFYGSKHSQEESTD